MKTLAIETSCDDTSLAIINKHQGIFEVEELIAYSQIQEHQKFWGVVPEIASRLHSEKILALLQQLNIKDRNDLECISVTSYPGLPGSLVVWKTIAYQLGAYLNIPVIPVNHILGHLFSIFLERSLDDIPFPIATLTASGGHNDLYIVEKKTEAQKGLKKTEYESFEFSDFLITKIGYTLDDAAGECFDKVSRMLWGPYPGGARIGEQAKKGKKNPKIQFKRIFLAHEKYEFSFSGMKSQVSFLLEKLKKEGEILNDQYIADIAYEFQEAVIEVLAKKLFQAAKERETKTIAIAGGVSANQRLKEYITSYLKEKAPELQFFSPKKNVYSTDNGAMIGLVWLLSNW